MPKHRLSASLILYSGLILVALGLLQSEHEMALACATGVLAFFACRLGQIPLDFLFKTMIREPRNSVFSIPNVRFFSGLAWLMAALLLACLLTARSAAWISFMTIMLAATIDALLAAHYQTPAQQRIKPAR